VQINVFQMKKGLNFCYLALRCWGSF